MKNIELQDHDESEQLLDKMRRGNLLSGACPSRQILKHITSQWGVLILIVLQNRVLRFSELRRAIDGVSERMLAQTLQALEKDGILDRTVFDVVPPHVEYKLTPLGLEAAKKVGDLAHWIEDNLPAMLDFQKQYEK